VGRSADLPRVSGRFDGDDTGCTMLHVDMDAFFASVEIRRRPELRHRPVIVGGGVRGVVSAASYPARRYGVRSAMSMSKALRLCPQAVVLPPDRAAYTDASQRVMAILRDVTPLVEPLSLDEAFLDVAGAQRLHGRPGAIAADIRARVEAELELTCSVGVAPTKFVAKLASARCKPDGLLVVPAAGVLDFLHPLPVSALWGVGERTAETLHRRGIRTVADLAHTPVDTLRRAVGSAAAEHLSELAMGVDPRSVETDGVEKSISADHTLDTDLTTEPEVRHQLLALAEEVGRRVRDRAFVARTVGIKIRYDDFRTITRVRTLPGATDSTDEIFRTAVELYRALDHEDPRIRLVGVKAENLTPAAEAVEQLALDLGPPARPAPAPPRSAPAPLRARSAPAASTPAAPEPARPPARPERAGRADRAIDAARARFGPGAVRPGSLLGTPVERPGREPRPDAAGRTEASADRSTRRPDDAAGEPSRSRPGELSRD
jgi:DNA polymerase IV